MNGFEGLEAHLHRTVHRGARGGQNADHLEGLVGVFVLFVLLSSVVMTMVMQAMAQRDALAQAIAQLARHFGTDHRLVQTIQRIGKRRALLQDQRLFVAISKVLKKRGRGAQHRKTPVRVAQT